MRLPLELLERLRALQPDDPRDAVFRQKMGFPR